MGKRVVTDEMKERICELREQRGWSYRRIGIEVGVSAGSVAWHCLTLGADKPGSENEPSPNLPMQYKRGNHTVRRFTPEEDEKILKLSAQGMGCTQIGAAVVRRHHSDLARLAMLARRDARAEAAANKSDHGAAPGPTEKEPKHG